MTIKLCLKCVKLGWDIHDKIPYLYRHIPISINVPAIAIVLVLTMLLVRGVKGNLQKLQPLWLVLICL